MIPLELLIMVIIGIFCGITAGIIGASGVMIVVSFLHLLLDFSMYTALGTSLGVDLITAITTTLVYHKHGNVDIGKGVWMMLAALVGIQVGGRIVVRTPETYLQGLFALFLFIPGVFLLRGELGEIDRIRDGILDRFGIPAFHEMGEKKQKVISLAAGFLIGILCGFQGAGGGLMFLIALIVILDYPIHKAVGTSTLMMMATAGVGTVTYGLLGAIDWLAVLIIGFIALPINRIAAKEANKLPEKRLSQIGGGIFILFGVLMLLFINL